MAEYKLIKLSKAKKIFPNKTSVMRSHDLVNISLNNISDLTKSEQRKLHNVAGEIRSGNLFGENTDIIITRSGKIIKIMPFK